MTPDPKANKGTSGGDGQGKSQQTWKAGVKPQNQAQGVGQGNDTTQNPPPGKTGTDPSTSGDGDTGKQTQQKWKSGIKPQGPSSTPVTTQNQTQQDQTGTDSTKTTDGNTGKGQQGWKSAWPVALGDKVKNSVATYSNSQPQPLQSCPQPQVAVVQPPTQVATAPEPQQEEKPWTLAVVVKSQKTFWPQAPGTVKLKMVEGDSGNEERPVAWSSTSAGTKLDGKGHQKYEVSVTVDKWDLVEAKTVTLENGDDKRVELKIKPRPWVAFKVIDQKGKPVEKVNLKVALPDDRTEEPVTSSEAIRIEDIKKSGTCKIEWMSHDELWEFVDLTSSAWQSAAPKG